MTFFAQILQSFTEQAAFLVCKVGYCQRKTAIMTMMAVALTGVSTLLFLFGDVPWLSLVSL